MVMDKTGTLTRGRFSVTHVSPAVGTPEALLSLAAQAEVHSNHPIAVSIKNAAPVPPVAERTADIIEISGQGISCRVDSHAVLAGNAVLMSANGVSSPSVDSLGSVVHIAQDGVYRGYIEISDTIKPDAKAAIAALKSLGVERTVMLTGDHPGAAAAVASALNLDDFHASLLPADKVERVREISATKTGTLAFVGDGINDAPVLAMADVGIAMGGLGSDAAIEAADVVIMDDKPSKLADAIAISRKTLAICRQNIIFALGVKFLVIILGALGLVGMWAAVFGDVGVSILCILNSFRALGARPLAVGD